MSSAIPENLYKGELISYPGPWAFGLPKNHIILVSDQELELISDPDKVINVAMGYKPDMKSLRDLCENAVLRGSRTFILAFDHFFSQYRPGQAGPRKFTPDSDEYIRKIAQISKFVGEYGMKLELSLMSPLEIGPAYRASTGESGVWMHYRKGLRDPKTGAFSVQLWQHLRWANNKGIVDLEDAGVRVFAFKEDGIGGTPYKVVDPSSIVEITSTAKVERFENTISKCHEDFRAQRIRVYGEGGGAEGLDRVFVVQHYKTPEMDYFSDQALPFLQNLTDKYVDAGVQLNSFYSDEMHIQQDWSYFNHHDNGNFALRYVSDGLAKRFAEKFGEQYRDFAKYMIYFAYGQEDFAGDMSAKQGIMHVFGESPEAVRKTALFRAQYYHLLQDGVVDLFVKAKRHAEERFGYKLESRAHATWAESPTLDYWEIGQEPRYKHQYEYTSNFVWSNTVHQAAAACYDYFKWGEFLTGTGNDHCECGWVDRNYLGLALACSTGIINEVPNSYAAHWGMPQEYMIRRNSLVDTFGDSGSPLTAIVQNAEHRDVEVLMLYPIDLVAVEERFGSWMTQYGYANLITQAKLIEMGKVVNGAIELAGRRFTTLAATFEPFPSQKLLEMMREMIETGGRVIWSGPVPLLTSEGTDALKTWQEIFGVRYNPTPNEGLFAPGRQVKFEGALASVEPQIILTDFLVDHIYPVELRDGTSIVARVNDHIVGTSRKSAKGGTAAFLGFRPRDDQSRSLGYETRTWFDVLCALGAYPSTGKFEGINDNTEYVSRLGDYMVCRFPNRAITLCRHFRHVEEEWDGGFSRKKEDDDAYFEKHPAPTDAVELTDFKVNGRSITYTGSKTMAFRTNEQNELVAFSGSNCSQVTIDGKTTVFAEQSLAVVAWAPVPKERRVESGALLQIFVRGNGNVRVPIPGLPQNLELVTEGSKRGCRGTQVPCHTEGDLLIFEANERWSGQWMYAVPKE